MGKFGNLEKIGAEMLLQRYSWAKWVSVVELTNKADGLWGNTQLLKTNL